jgi:hypothetical protein
MGQLTAVSSHEFPVSGAPLTLSGIAYVVVGHDQHEVALHNQQDGVRIYDVLSWSRSGVPKVPSVISYAPSEACEAQWGAEVSDSAVAMIWTKLELDEQDRLEELDLLLKALNGMADLELNQIAGAQGLPSYPAKEPEEIIADYLHFMRAHLVEHELEGPLSNFGANWLRRVTVDVVVTCPLVCRSQQGLDAKY